MFSRREFLAVLAAGGMVVAGELWIPGQKLISIPSRKIFIPEGRLAWIEDGVVKMYGGRGVISIPRYFDTPVVGAEISQEAFDHIRSNSGEMWRG